MFHILDELTIIVPRNLSLSRRISV